MEAFFSFSGLFNAIVSTLLGLFVFFKNRHNKVNQTFALFCLAVATWSYPYALWPISKTKEEVLFWFQLLHIGASFGPITYLHFVTSWLDLVKKRVIKIIILVGYALAIFFASSVFSPYFIKDIVPKFSMKFWAVPGPLYQYYLIFFFGYFLYASYLLIKEYKKTTDAKQLQIKYILGGMVLAFLGGSTNYPLWYNINFPPYGNILASSYVILSAYAIVTQRLMDIKVALRKSFVYVSSIIAIVLPAIVTAYYSEKILPQYSIYINSVILIFAVSVFTSVRNYFYRLANKYFFSSLYDSAEVAARFGEKLRSIIEIDKIYNLISDTIINTFHSKSVGILNYEKDTGKYKVKFNNGFDLDGQEVFPGDKKLHELFIRQSKSIMTEEVKSIAYQEHKEILDVLSRFGVALIVPLNIKDETLGVIVLGLKEAKDVYNNEDLRTLEIIASQATFSIKNAELYEETRRFSKTLQKEVERQTAELKNAYEELKVLDKAKSEFISLASHQLRTPLTAIKGYISMMLEGSYGKLPGSASKPLDNVLGSAERLIRIVNDLLNISKIELGKMELNKSFTKIEELITACCEEMKPAVEKKDLKLIWHKPKSHLPEIEIDKLKIGQVFLNLIDNAIKYTQKGEIEIKAEKTDSIIRVSIKDTGEGLTEDELKMVFEGFTRGAAGIAYWIEGAGLGLYIAKKYIDLHNGKIWVESEGRGKGSAFYVELPIK